jgi:hypothetical protein
MAELALDALLLLVAAGTTMSIAVAHALLVTLTAVMGNQPGEAILLDFPCNQLFDKGNIDPNPVSYPAGTDFVGMELGDDVNLLFPAVGTATGVTVWRRWSTLIRAVGLLAHEPFLAADGEKAN